MNREFWINRWNQNQIGFHLHGVNPLLTKYWPQLRGRVLVPLCGKSEDLCWLAERRLEVVGVEVSLVAAKAFAAEQGIVFTETDEPPFTVLRADWITYYVGDFFDFAPDIAGVFDAFYDRAALIALPPELRPGYVRRLKSLMADRAQGLLIGLEYDPTEMHGPPFTVPDGEVQSLFEGLPCEKLLEYDCLDQEPKFKERGLSWMKETVYRVGKF